MARAFWHTEFEWRLTHLRVRDTGAVVPFTWPIIKETLAWMRFYAALQPVRAWRSTTQPPLRLSFAPSPPSAWYLLWAAARAAGARFTAPEDADAVFYFEDQTTGETPHVPIRSGATRLNFHCTDVSKSRVAAVFEQVFGYPLTVDPRTHQGPAVEKSEANGVHDGRIVQCPVEPLEGRSYARVVDNVAPDGLVEDIRCPTLLGDIPVAFIKRRPLATRFANANAQVRLIDPADVLSEAERAKLKAFCAAMHLDWGGLDVLRDRRDGRLYVVDVNKTDMGPPTALSLGDQLRAAVRLGDALRHAFTPDTASETHGLVGRKTDAIP